MTSEEQKEVLAEAQEVINDAEEQWKAARRRRAGIIIEPPKVVYCMAIYEERMDQVLTCLKRVRPYVDRCVIVVDESVTPESKEALSKWGCKVVFRHWDDHFSKQRNMYLENLREGEWALVSDPDELFSESLMQDLKKIVLASEQEGFNSLSINAHDITTQLDGQVTSTTSDWFKQLLFRYEEGVRYVGCVHETLLPGIHGWHTTNLKPKYYYEHFKSMIEVKERGARNIFCGGGGNNVKNINPMYDELHHASDRLGITRWPDMRKYIREGQLDPELKEIIVKHRNDSGWDWENESRDWFLWCKAILPDQFKEWESTPQPPSVGSPPEVMAYVEEQYLKMLNRNADEGGKRSYTEAIITGRINREDLPNILKTSQEYKERHGDEA
jgi:hypothetical protein